tara:strand:- start:319 stop:921 length:603 start_codon:yes stop_codon:yes gene_type:complete
MFDKKKVKNQGLPDFPRRMSSIPSIEDYDRTKIPLHDEELENEPIHNLPSFPDSPMKEGFSQSAIIDAVASPENKIVQNHELPNLPSEINPHNMPHQDSRTTELEEWKPQSIQTPMNLPQISTPKVDPNKPIFIKLSNFKEAKESIDIIKEKLKEMDNLLKIIKDVKVKESQELLEWEKETEKIKARINAIQTGFFENAI